MSTRTLPKLPRPSLSREWLRSAGLQFLLSLVLSLALWTFVSFSVNPTARLELSVPVVVGEPPAGLILVDPATGEPVQPERRVTVLVVGPQLDLNQLTAEDFRATLDLSQLSAGLHSVPVHVEGPRGVRIRQVEPASIQVRLAPLASRTLPVAPLPRNNPPFLYQARAITVTAKEAVASGPSDLMQRVARIVAPVDLNGRTSSFTEEVALVAVDGDDQPVPGITLTPARARVSVQIVPRVDRQRVAVAPRIINQPAPGYVAEDVDWNPRFVDVISPLPLSGPIETEPIDLTGRTESFTTTVKLVNPDPATTQLLTDTVTVSIPIRPFRIPTEVPWFVAVTPVNVAPTVQATVQPPGLTLTISGTADQLQQLVTNSPQATVDVAGLGPGSYTLPVTIELPPGLRLVGAPPQVTVTITPVATPTATPGVQGG